MWTWVGVMIVTAGAGVLGCAQPPSATAAAVEDKTYTVAPAAMPVKAGIVTGEVTEMTVTEQVEPGCGRVVSPAKLMGKVVLTNSSANETLGLVGGTMQYLDAQGQPITLEETRTEPTLKFSAYGSDRLDPGQEAKGALVPGGAPGQPPGQRGAHRHGLEGFLDESGSEEGGAVPRVLPESPADRHPERPVRDYLPDDRA